jgi:hypothetical protein
VFQIHAFYEPGFLIVMDYQMTYAAGCITTNDVCSRLYHNKWRLYTSLSHQRSEFMRFVVGNVELRQFILQVLWSVHCQRSMPKRTLTSWNRLWPCSVRAKSTAGFRKRNIQHSSSLSSLKDEIHFNNI